MQNKIISQIKFKAEKLFLDLGFKKLNISSENIYEYKNMYLKFTYLDAINSFVIECAISIEGVYKNLYEDSDILQVSLGEKELLCQLQQLLVSYYL